MSRKKVCSSVEVVLSADDKRKFASFFVLLIAIDRRENKRNASKKKSKKIGQKHDGLGPQTYLRSKPNGCKCSRKIGLA